MNKTTIFFSLLLLASGWFFRGMPVANARIIEIPENDILAISDGDTIKVRLDGRKERIRVLGVDTPEIKGQCLSEKMLAVKAKEFTTWLVRNQRPLLLEWDGRRDKYKRPLAWVFLGGHDLSHRLDKLLIKEGFAVRYQPRPDSFWCQ